MGPQAVHQPRAGSGQEAAPYAVVRPVQRVAAQFGGAAGVEDAYLQALGVLGEHGKVHAAVAGQRAQGLLAAGQQSGRQAVRHRQVILFGVLCMLCAGGPYRVMRA